MNIIKLEEVSLIDSNKLILSNINLDIEKNDLITIIGPSGSGKSTLLKIISSLKSPTNGRLYFEGKPYSSYNITDFRKNVAYCFQEPYLFGDTVMDDLSFPFKIRGMHADLTLICSYLDSFELSSDMLNENCNKLSGGEKQRISLIRSILFHPKVLLLDEVTSSLDNKNTALVEKNITKLNNEGITILWVTHDIDQSSRLGKKRLVIENGHIKNFEVLK